MPSRYLRKDPQRNQAGDAAQASVERTSSSAVRNALPAHEPPGLISCVPVAQGTTSTAAAAAASSVPRAGQSDVWDLMEPEDILTKLGKRDGEKAPFLQAASSEKWKGAFQSKQLLLSCSVLTPCASSQSGSLHFRIFASWLHRRASLLATMARSHAPSSEC